MTSQLPPLQPGRKRRAHKRSRNGCLTCKQRHIRCDEVKPICTNCLTRGGDCGYPEPGGTITPGSTSGSAAGASFASAELIGRKLVAVPSSPADPFDCLPIKMPLRSLELFHHYTHYRIFSRTAVPKNPDSECVGISLSSPGTFRACLLMTALNYSWLSGSGSLKSTDMEETYLYHKLEAMRLVNEQLADAAQSTSDGCLSLIAALALVESGMGDHVAAEAHLNGLFTLLDMKRPDKWQHRFYGMLQRLILAIGSYIAAAKSLGSSSAYQYIPQDPDLGLHEQVPHYTRHPSLLFSTAPMIATKLSPFYFGASPGVEACKADVEGLVLINALRRLSLLPVVDPTTTAAASSRSSSLQPNHFSHTPSPCAPSQGPEAGHLPPGATAALVADTDAYISSLLFKPHPVCRDIRPCVQPGSSPQRSHSRSISPASSSCAKTFNLPIRVSSPAEDIVAPVVSIPFTSQRSDPYEDLSPEFFPSSSRAWATAAYLFLHVFLAPGLHTHPLDTTSRRDQTSIDPHLLRLLLNTLRADLQHTEEAMGLGAYSSELWLWKAVIGAYTIDVVGAGSSGGRFIKSGELKKNRREDPAGSGGCGHGSTSSSSTNFYGWIVEDESQRRMGSASVEMDSTDDIRVNSEKDADVSSMEDLEDGCFTAEKMGAWFDACLRSWSRAAHVTEWATARQMLGRIVWPEIGSGVFEGEGVVEGLWWRAVEREGGNESESEKERWETEEMGVWVPELL